MGTNQGGSNQIMDILTDIIKNSNKTFGRIGFVGDCRQGNFQFFKEAKKYCNVLIAEHVDYLQKIYYLARNMTPCPTFPSFETIKIKLTGNTDVNFLINSLINDEITQKAYTSIEYYNETIKWCYDLNLNKPFSFRLSAQVLYNMIDTPMKQIQSFICPYNILSNLISKKFNSTYQPMYIWQNFQNGFINHIEFDQSLLKIINIMVDKILTGITSYTDLNKCMYSYYMEKPQFIMLDMNTLEKIDHINKNCIMILQNEKNTEVFFIQNDNLVY